MAGIFEFAGGGVLKPYIPAGGGKTQKYARSGVGLVQFGAADAGLLHRDVGAKNSDVREVRAAIGECLEWCNVAWEGTVGNAVFNIYGMANGV